MIKKWNEFIRVYESYRSEYDSSIRKEDVEKIISRILSFNKIGVMDNTADPEGLIKDLERELSNFDEETIELVVDTILFADESDYWKDWALNQIVSIGDKIMRKYGTEPDQVLNAYETAFNFLNRLYDWEEVNETKTKSQIYKGKKIPGKYLSGPHPSKMKKEIDKFRDSKEYKKDWDADYTSGKGGEGKRVKTKKSAATKAYQKMFGKK